MFKSSLLLVGFVTIVNFGVVFTEDYCVVPFGSKTDWNIFWPLVFHENGTLYPTNILNDEGSVEVLNGESVLISCGPNYLKKFTPKLFVNAKCEKSGKFQIGDGLDLKKAKDLACDLRVIDEVLVPVEGCTNDKTAVKFGYVNPIDSFSYVIGEACYSTEKGQTIFAHVRIGEPLEVQSKRFFTIHRHPESSYKIDFMKASRLDVLQEKLQENFDLQTVPEYHMSNFVSEHLLSNDQLYAVKKLAWNYFMQHDNVVNLQRLKQDIGDLGRNVDIYIGSHGASKMEATKGGKKGIYMEGSDKFPIPEFIWVVVKNADKATAFVIFNDPNISDNEAFDDSICESKCEQIDWLKQLRKDNQFSNGRHGLVLCCEYNEFQKTVEEMPKLSGVKELYI